MMEKEIAHMDQEVKTEENIQDFMQIQRPYKLRKLQAQDIPAFAKIIGKIGIDEMVSCYGDEDITELLLKLKNRKNVLGEAEPDAQRVLNQMETRGVTVLAGEEAETEAAGDEWVMGIAVATRIANKLLQNLEQCMGDVFYLLGRLSDMTPDEVGELDLNVFVLMITDVITGNNIVNFIKAAIKFI